MLFSRKKKETYEIEALLKTVKNLKKENNQLQQTLLKNGDKSTVGGDYSIIGLADGILKLSATLEVVYINSCLATLLTLDKIKIIGSVLENIDTDLLWGDGFLGALLEKAKENGGETAVQVERVQKEGDILYFYITVRTLHDGGYQVLFENISIQKLAELELIEKENQLRESQKMQAIGTLAGGVAHDFNNLLTIIQINAELLQMEVEGSTTAVEYIDEIRQTVHNAGNLARQLLVFSRRKALSFKVEDLGEITHTMVKMLTRVLGANINVTTSFKDNLPRVQVDRGSMEQILLNLAINARDAMPDGGTLSITTAAAVAGDTHGATEQVCLLVTDSGTGMSADTRKRIFEPFFTTKDIGSGTGLGLSVVYGIVKEHQGRIEVDSTEGGGTTFRIFIPAATDQMLFKEADDAPDTGGNGESILYVEDNDDVRKGTAEVLRKSHYTVDEAGTYEEALRLITQNTQKYQILLTDIVLPDGSGVKLADTARENFRMSTVALYSSHLDDDISEQIIRDKGYLFIRKPFTKNDLLRIIRRARVETELL